MKGIAIVAFIAGTCGAQDFGFAVKFAAEREGKVVTGAPYSAQAVTETTQVLADGNRITRKSSSLVARDGQGRTRREQNLNVVGPWSASSQEPSSTTVFINDPVSGARYTLESNSHAAVKTAIGGAEQGVRQELEARLRAERRKLEAEGNNGMVRSESHVMVFTSDTPGMQIVTSSMESRNPPKTESLGTQIIEGVSAEGKRMTETIPAGKVGNERAIEVVNETWYSAELQTVVKSRHSDPRTGDVVYSLTNISRAEPDPGLFQVPVDYKVREETGGGNIVYKVRRPAQ